MRQYIIAWRWYTELQDILAKRASFFIPIRHLLLREDGMRDSRLRKGR